MKITAAVSRSDAPTPRLEQLDLAEPQVGELRIRMVATGICHTDLLFHGDFGSRFAPKPIVLGHEGAGIVEALGAGVSEFAVGDHVVLSGNSCGHCPQCHEGHTVYCDEMTRLCWSGVTSHGCSPLSACNHRVSGSFFGQSSFATYVIASTRTAVRVPKEAPLHLMGPLSCGMITGAGSVLKALRVRPGQSIAIFGAGGVGLAAVMAARIAGAARIVAIDIDKQRLDLACSLGATHSLLSDADTISGLAEIAPRGFDFSLVTASPSPVFDAAVACLAVEGTAGFVIDPHGAWSPDMLRLLTGGRKLQGIIGGNANAKTFIPTLVDYWQRGEFPFDHLITEYPFERIEDAWNDFRDGKVIKPVLRISQG